MMIHKAFEVNMPHCGAAWAFVRSKLQANNSWMSNKDHFHPKKTGVIYYKSLTSYLNDLLRWPKAEVANSLPSDHFPPKTSTFWFTSWGLEISLSKATHRRGAQPPRISSKASSVKPHSSGCSHVSGLPVMSVGQPCYYASPGSPTTILI